MGIFPFYKATGVVIIAVAEVKPYTAEAYTVLEAGFRILVGYSEVFC